MHYWLLKMKKLFYAIIFLGLLFGGNVYSAETRTVEESDINVAWKVDGKFIKPECFEVPWPSGNRYESFYDKYFKKPTGRYSEDPDLVKFRLEVGNYLNKEAPLNDVINLKGDKSYRISLTRQLDSCLVDKPETSLRLIDKSEDSSRTLGYAVVHSFDLKIGKELAPHINKKFESIKEVRTFYWGGGKTTTYDTAVFGVLDLEGKKVLLPLRNKSMIPKEKKTINTVELYDWIKNQTERVSANSIINDERFTDLLEKEIPKNNISLGMSRGEKVTLIDSLLEVLYGAPGELIYSDDRTYMTTDACRYQSCDEKGFVFMNTEEKFTIGLIRHFSIDGEETKNWDEGDFLIFSKTHKSFDEIPKVFIQSVKNWVANSTTSPNKVRFIGADNSIKEVENLFK